MFLFDGTVAFDWKLFNNIMHKFFISFQLEWCNRLWPYFPHFITCIFFNKMQYFYADNTHGQTWKM